MSVAPRCSLVQGFKVQRMRKRATVILITLGLAWASGSGTTSAQLLTGDSLLGGVTTLVSVALSPLSKIDALAERRLARVGSSRVVLRAIDAVPASSLIPVVMDVGGIVTRSLPVINAQVADVPN